jgi:hypothetical protein
MHPEDREIYLIEQLSGLNSMFDLAREFHPETAERIDELFQRISQPLEPPSDVAAAKILSRACRITEVGDIGQRFQPKEHQVLVLG